MLRVLVVVVHLPVVSQCGILSFFCVQELLGIVYRRHLSEADWSTTGGFPLQVALEGSDRPAGFGSSTVWNVMLVYRRNGHIGIRPIALGFV